MGVTATLRGSVIGQEVDDDLEPGTVSLSGNPYEYEEEVKSYQTAAEEAKSKAGGKSENVDSRRVKLNKVLMPSGATVSFAIKGWLASGIKVESLSVDAKRSKGLGAGVTPYKGVKYLCVSRKGVESRC